MNRDQLDQRNTAVITRHWRTLADSGGKPSPELLADLAVIAEDYAAGLHRAANEGMVPASAAAQTVTVTAGDPPGTLSGSGGAGGGGEFAPEPSLAVTPGEPERRTVPARTTPARTRTRNRGAK